MEYSSAQELPRTRQVRRSFSAHGPREVRTAPEIVQRRNFVAKIDNHHLESANPGDDDVVARRSFLKGLAALSVTASVGNMSLLAAAAGQTFDYIVVAAWPGGGPL